MSVVLDIFSLQSILTESVLELTYQMLSPKYEIMLLCRQKASVQQLSSEEPEFEKELNTFDPSL